MSHNLSRFTDQNGQERDAFYSLRENGWHKLGQVVDRPLADPELIRAAGLDWSADAVGLYTTAMDPVTTHKAIVRSDTKAQLGIVGAGYNALSNADLLAFFRDVAGVRDFTVETAGALGKGETVWMLARIPGLELAKGDDISRGYMLIRNNHDGQSSARIVPTMVRVVCANTMAMAQSEENQRRGRHGRNTLSGGWCVRHTSGIKTALADIADAYARTLNDYETTRAAFSALTGKPLSSAAFDKMMLAAFAANPKESGEESERSKTIAKNRSDRIHAILASATCNVSGTAGTLWAGLNAITEYVDHDARTRSIGNESDAAQRFASSCFDGAGSKAKAAAWEAALALV